VITFNLCSDHFGFISRPHSAAEECDKEFGVGVLMDQWQKEGYIGRYFSNPNDIDGPERAFMECIVNQKHVKDLARIFRATQSYNDG